MSDEPRTPWSSDDDLEADLVRRAGGPEAAAAFRDWQPYRPRAPRDHDDDADVLRDDDGDPLTPWADGAELTMPQPRRAWGLGFVATRRQILAGYLDPDTGRLVEGQVPRAVRELGDQATVEEIADRLAVSSGDREFLEVLVPGATVTTDVEESP